MFSIAEQFSSATKSQFASQLKIISSLASTAVASAEQVIALNLSTTKASVEKSSKAAKQLLHAKDPQEFIKLSTTPSASLESLMAYGSELFSIASKAQAELFRAANEQVKEAPLAPVLKLAAPVAAAEPKVAKAPAKAKPAAVVAVVAVEEPVAEAAPVTEVAAPAPAAVVAEAAPVVVAEVAAPVVAAAKPAPLKSVPASKKQK